MNCIELNTAPRMNSKAGKYIQITTILAEDADSPPSYLRRIPSIILHRLPALAFPPPAEPFGANGHIQDTLIQCCQFLFTRICALKLFSRAV